MLIAKTRWQFRQSDPVRVRQIAKQFKIDPIVAQIMVQRGVDDPVRADRFLAPDMKRLTDPEGIPGIAEAADLIHQAITENRTIVIYSDYDVDGVCGLTILAECLQLAGANHLVPYIPHRIEEGYGLNSDAVRAIAAENPGALMVTIDCGITAVEQVAEARSLGLDVIITDHHTFRESLPEALVLVHPQLPGADPTTATLCGAGVAFKLAWQVGKKFGDGKKASPAMRDYLLRSMGLVALATVADVMPLVDENRILVKHGINSLNDRRTPGMEALLQMSGVSPDKPVSSTTIGFQIAPRINAAGRMLHAFTAFQLLTTKSAQEAQQLAETLEETNRLRREIEAEIVRQAKAQFESDPKAADRNVIVVADQNWHLGVVGIAASRLMETYNRPTVVLSIQESGLAHGSGRSVKGVNLVDALGECKSLLTTFGGHAAAAGMKLPAESVDEFREVLDKAVADRRESDPGLRELWIDAEVTLSQLSIGLVNAINDLEPHGHGNEKPVLAMGGLELVGEPMVMGKDRTHLRFNLKQGNMILKVLAWGMAELATKLQKDILYDLAFTVSISQWQGRVEVQAEMKDLRPSSMTSHGGH